MQELRNIGISDSTIKSMIELNREVLELSDNEVLEKEKILSDLDCDNIQILNIISSNPNFLARTSRNILELILYLKKLGFNCLNILFDSNPYILNLEPFEVQNYVSARIKNGESIEGIVDDLDSNPYLFNEM